VADISIIIINWNTKQLLLDCIASVYETVHTAAFEIIVVDNGSADRSVEAVAGKYPNVTVIANKHNEGFAKANNAAMRRMTGEFAVLLNSDTVLKDHALDRMLAFMKEHPRAGMCGPQLLFRDGSPQTSTGSFPKLLNELTSASMVRFLSSRNQRALKPLFSRPAAVDFIIGACMFVRKSAINEAGMLDEDYFFFYEEIDWCCRLNKAGWLIYHLPDIEIFHFGGQSTKNINLRARAESWRSRYLFFQKSRGLTKSGIFGVRALGLTQTLYHFLGHSVLNGLTLFSLKRLRKRWTMYGYVLLWHLRGFPTSMCLPRR
jgi:GT2 family glycosyltransferase